MRAAPLVTLVLVIIAFFANRRRRKPSGNAAPVLTPTLTPEDAADQLTHSDWRMRKAAVETLAAMPDERHIPQFARLLADPDEDVRTAARQALISLRDASVPALVTALQAEAWVPAEGATQALAVIGGAQAEAALAQALGHRSAWVRLTAANAIGQLHAVSAVPALATAVADEDADVRQAITDALREIGTPEALDVADA